MASWQGYHWHKGTKIKMLSFLCKKFLNIIPVILSVIIDQIKTPKHSLITFFLQGSVLISCFCISFQSDMDAEEEQEDDAGPLEQVSDWLKVRECGAVTRGRAVIVCWRSTWGSQRKKGRALQRDDIALFLTSFAPAMKHSTPERQSWVKLKMQLCHEAEARAVYSHQYQQFTLL